MKNAILNLGDRMLGAFLPKERAAACYVNYCDVTDCTPVGLTNCEYRCLQTCYQTSPKATCYSDYFCSG